MAHETDRTDPELWETVKDRVTKGDKGGKAGEWSARKAQLAVSEYKKEGGGYRGKKDSQNHLQEWQDEDWGTRSGKPSGETGERYLPKEARKALSKREYDRTTAKKRADSRRGHQFSAQPEDVAKKTAKFRHGGGARADGPTRAALYAEAKARNIPVRSTMDKAALEKALHGAP